MVRSQRLAAVDAVVVEAAEHPGQHAVAEAVQLPPGILTLRRKVSRLLRLLRRPRPVPLPRLAALPLAAVLVPPAQVLQLLHRPEVEDAEALCQLPPAPAAHPRAAALPTGPAMERSRRAS